MTTADRQTVDALVGLVHTLVDDFDVIEFLDELCARCVSLLDVTATGVLLVDHRGTLGLVAASDEQTRTLELLQLQEDEGPCLDCYHTGSPVLSDDLERESVRWPRFAAAARAGGFAAVHALPMRLRDQILGGLNLFSARSGSLSPDTLRLAQLLADVASIGIVHERNLRHPEVVVEQLQSTMNNRVTFEQAKGVLAEHLGISVVDASTLLRRHASRTRTPLSDIAVQVVDGSIAPATIMPTPDPDA